MRRILGLVCVMVLLGACGRIGPHRPATASMAQNSRVTGMPDIVVFIDAATDLPSRARLVERLAVVACVEVVSPSRGAREFGAVFGTPVPVPRLPWVVKVAFDPELDRGARLRWGQKVAWLLRGADGITRVDIGPELVPPDSWAPPACAAAGG